LGLRTIKLPVRVLATTIAYQVVGDAPVDLLYVPGWFFNP